MRIWIKVLLKNMVVFRTTEIEFMHPDQLRLWLNDFKKCIDKECEIYIHRVRTDSGVQVIDFDKQFKKLYDNEDFN